MKLSHRICGAPLLGGLLAWVVLMFAPARGHNTVVYDSQTALRIGGAGNISGPFTLLAMGAVRVLPESIEIDLTMADGAAYKLLASDPYQVASATGANGSTPATTAGPAGQGGLADAHFLADKPLLIQRGATLFTLTSKDATLAPLAVSVEMTASQDVVFHLTYPPARAWPLHLQLNCFERADPGQKALINVMDPEGNSLNLATVDAQTPSLDIEAPAPPATAIRPSGAAEARHWLGVVAGVVAGLAVVGLLIKLRQSAEKG